MHRLLWLVPCLATLGCEAQPSVQPAAAPAAAPAPGGNSAGPTMMSVGIGSGVRPSDDAQVRSADYSILFLGNSHTMLHDIPGLVRQMIEFLLPGKKVYTHAIGIAFLENIANDRRVYDEIESRPWKHVVLQAQKISMSGKYKYSQKEGVDFAKAAKVQGASVLFFSEWGRKDVPGDGDAQEKIYQSMANAADAKVAAVNRAWDMALAKKPDLPLHDFDGNHQTATGAFLTACVLTASITGESPASLANYPFPDVNEADRSLLANSAASVFADQGKKSKAAK